MGWVEQKVVDAVRPLNDATHTLGCALGVHSWASLGLPGAWVCRYCDEMKAGRK